MYNYDMLFDLCLMPCCRAARRRQARSRCRSRRTPSTPTSASGKAKPAGSAAARPLAAARALPSSSQVLLLDARARRGCTDMLAALPQNSALASEGGCLTLTLMPIACPLRSRHSQPRQRGDGGRSVCGGRPAAPGQLCRGGCGRRRRQRPPRRRISPDAAAAAVRIKAVQRERRSQRAAGGGPGVAAAGRGSPGGADACVSRCSALGLQLWTFSNFAM